MIIKDYFDLYFQVRDNGTLVNLWRRMTYKVFIESNGQNPWIYLINARSEKIIGIKLLQSTISKIGLFVHNMQGKISPEKIQVTRSQFR